MPSVDWGSALEAAGDEVDEFEIIPTADYNFLITSAEPKVSQNGKTMYLIRCRITEGPHKGRVLLRNLVVSPENETSMKIFFKQMSALGMPRAFFAAHPSDQQICDNLVNKEFRGSVQTEQYQGQSRNKIGSIFPAARVSGAATPPPPPPPAASSATPPPPPPPEEPAEVSTSGGTEPPPF